MSTPVSAKAQIHREIQNDWNNREFVEVISHNIRKLADFLNSFELSCRSKLAFLNERLTTLERRIEYLEARAFARGAVVTPLDSVTEDEARHRVRRAYKEWMRFIPHLCFYYEDQLQKLHPRLVRDAVKRKFAENRSVADIRAIDQLAYKAEVELRNTKENWNQSPQLLSSLFQASVNPKPADFLGKFLAGKD